MKLTALRPLRDRRPDIAHAMRSRMIELIHIADGLQVSCYPKRDPSEELTCNQQTIVDVHLRAIDHVPP